MIPAILSIQDDLEIIFPRKGIIKLFLKEINLQGRTTCWQMAIISFKSLVNFDLIRKHQDVETTQMFITDE